jgi:hypothetical protein
MTPAFWHAAVWTATHDNGWTTGVTENPDGTFAAWLTRETTGPVIPEYIEDSPENAMRAAEYALHQKTGHDRCSPACSGWQLHQHPHRQPESEEEEDG